MKLTETIKSTPLEAEQTVRRNDIRALTSCQAGKVIPLSYIPVLREDRVSRGQVRVRLEMQETVKTLMNAINVTVMAHFVPFLAFERFNGLDQMNRSYMGQPEVDGGTVIPFFDTVGYHNNAEFFNAMGLHAVNNTQVNAAPLEAYNVLVNWRRRARSTKLPQRNRLDKTLAQGFWKNTAMRHIVPDYDQAMMDGEVPLNVTKSLLKVVGIGNLQPTQTYPIGNFPNTLWSNNIKPKQANRLARGDSTTTATDIYGRPRVFAEMEQNGITVSLSNIEMAKKTAAFAEMRKEYAGLDDDHLIDLLMQAVRVPDAMMAQPMLLDQKSTVMGYSRRYATDGANLEKSVTTGETFVDIRFRTPPMNTGGIILLTAEMVPEQLFERQKDHFLHTTDVDDLPQFTRDFLDPEKVSIVRNDHVDVLHGTPNGVFGYAPLNHEWQRNLPNIGGKFMRPVTEVFDEDRQRIWSVETLDPSLTEDFYLVNNLHNNVFADTTADPFEITTLGRVEIVGNTVFGKALEENTGAWDDVSNEVDDGRIVQVGAATNDVTSDYFEEQPDDPAQPVSETPV